MVTGTRLVNPVDNGSNKVTSVFKAQLKLQVPHLCQILTEAWYSLGNNALTLEEK